MSYNLNFYPNDFNQSGFGNAYNPYATLLGLDNNAGLQYLQKDAENRLQQIQQMQNQFLPQSQQPNQQSQQPYYLFCGNKTDWDEFLMLNYGITEQNIFNDYKLFLQAKQELLEEQGQNKIDTMKNKIKNKDNKNIDATVQSNVKPVQQSMVQQPSQQQFVQQPTNQSVEQPVVNNGNGNSIGVGDSSQPNNGLYKQGGFKPKNTNRKR